MFDQEIAPPWAVAEQSLDFVERLEVDLPALRRPPGFFAAPISVSFGPGRILNVHRAFSTRQD